MLSKPSLLLLGMIHELSMGAYEITKRVQDMNIKWWFKISDATIYSTLRTMEKKGYITGIQERKGNLPEKRVYSITAKGGNALLEGIREAFLTFDFDTSYYSVAVCYASLLAKDELKELLKERLTVLGEHKKEVAGQIKKLEYLPADDLRGVHLQRLENIIDAEIMSAMRMLGKVRK